MVSGSVIPLEWRTHSPRLETQPVSHRRSPMKNRLRFAVFAVAALCATSILFGAPAQAWTSAPVIAAADAPPTDAGRSPGLRRLRLRRLARTGPTSPTPSSPVPNQRRVRGGEPEHHTDHPARLRKRRVHHRRRNDRPATCERKAEGHRLVDHDGTEHDHAGAAAIDDGPVHARRARERDARRSRGRHRHLARHPEQRPGGQSGSTARFTDLPARRG